MLKHAVLKKKRIFDNNIYLYSVSDSETGLY